MAQFGHGSRRRWVYGIIDLNTPGVATVDYSYTWHRRLRPWCPSGSLRRRGLTGKVRKNSLLGCETASDMAKAIASRLGRGRLAQKPVIAIGPFLGIEVKGFGDWAHYSCKKKVPEARLTVVSCQNALGDTIRYRKL